MRVLFLGDLFIGGDMLTYPPDSRFISSKTFVDADIVVANLEQVISDSDSVAEKGIIWAPSKATGYLEKLGINIVCLAQNHIHDKFNVGIKDTISHLQSIDMGFFGAGMNLEEAERPYKMFDNCYIIGGCSYRSYPKNVQFATKTEPGVNPIDINRIKKQITELPPGSKVILFLHWGREYVRFPYQEYLKLAQQLLKIKQVAMIIGGHAHVFQGVLTKNSKKAYMSLGNFLFPNFYMREPMIVHYPVKPIKAGVMRGYYRAKSVAQKKWKLANRLSYGVLWDSETNESKVIPYLQHAKRPFVKELASIPKATVTSLVSLFSILYQLPTCIYRCLVRLNTYTDYFSRKFGRFVFKLSEKRRRDI